MTDPERRSNREYTILAILLDEKEKHPTDTRTSFYLARTYNVIGNHSQAMAEFERRVSLGGWQEEVSGHVISCSLVMCVCCVSQHVPGHMCTPRDCICCVLHMLCHMWHVRMYVCRCTNRCMPSHGKKRHWDDHGQRFSRYVDVCVGYVIGIAVNVS